MNIKSKLSTRIQTLLDCFDADYLDKDPDERSAIYKRVFKQNEADLWSRKQALGLAAFLDEKRIVIKNYDLLAGNIEHYDYSQSLPLKLKKTAQYDFSRDAYDSDGEIAVYKASKEHRLSDEEDYLLKQLSLGIENRLFHRWAIGHVIPGYGKFLKHGLADIISADERQLADSSDKEQKITLENMLIVNKAVRKYILRYAEKAEELIENEDDKEYKQSLQRIADTCKKVASQAPESFFEAIQLLMLIHDVMICENRTGSMSLGRIDQMLYPFYSKDKENGRIDSDEALELISALWLKLARCRRGYQNVTLGGTDAQGEFAGNDLTLLCLLASGMTKKDQPLLSFRCPENVPDEYWREIMTLIRTGMGFPALFNDEVIFKAKKAVGIAEEDVWDYGIVGCVEPSIPGKEYSNNEEMRISWAKILEFMLLGNADDKEFKLKENHKLSEFKTFEAFYDWYKAELKYVCETAVKASILLDNSQSLRWTVPFLSSSMEGTHISGKDVSAGGAKYSLSSFNATGMADVVDSLAVIRELVFKQKRLSLTELAEVLRSDYRGNEELLSEIANYKGKFGNNIPEVDEIMAELKTIFVTAIQAFKNQWNQACQCGFYSVQHHADMGKYTASLPNGRRNGQALANSFSPCQGAEQKGPTATVNSLCCSDHSQLSNGLVFDLKFTPQFLETPKHQEALINLVKTYFRKGGMEIQFNIVDTETLLKAQANPLEYKDLIVRVSGFSMYFIYLDKVVQDEIIRRKAHE